jgi:DNA-binding CsgD family transcriptional regulator
VVIDDPVGPGRQTRLSLLSQAYRFTESEMRLLEKLVGGYSLSEIADARQLSLETIRTQLKSLFSKTGTHRQSDLVRLVS